MGQMAQFSDAGSGTVVDIFKTRLTIGAVDINFVTVVTRWPSFRHASVSPLTTATIFPKTEIVR